MPEQAASAVVTGARRGVGREQGRLDLLVNNATFLHPRQIGPLRLKSLRCRVESAAVKKKG